MFPGDAAEPAFSALPDDAPELTVAFYSVGINASHVGKKKFKTTETKLLADIVNVVKKHALDVFCLSELGELADVDALGPAVALFAQVAQEGILELLAAHLLGLVLAAPFCCCSRSLSQYAFVTAALQSLLRLRVHTEVSEVLLNARLSELLRPETGHGIRWPGWF